MIYIIYIKRDPVLVVVVKFYSFDPLLHGHQNAVLNDYGKGGTYYWPLTNKLNPWISWGK